MLLISKVIIHEPANGQQEISLAQRRQSVIHMLNFDYMKKILCLLTLLIALASASFAAESKTITLQDGSKVKGTILGMDNGFYIVESPSIGEIRIADSNVTSITTGEGPEEPAQPQEPSNITAMPQFQAIQAQVMNNPDVLGDIQKLMEDPEIMAVLSDPGFAQAVQSGNMTSVGSDPRLQHLSENPKIQALIQKIKSQQ